MTFTETIAWIPVSKPPDTDLTVLLFGTEASEPVWPGFFDGDTWRYADALV